MVKKLWNAVGREITGIHSAAYILAVFSFLADILGLLRDRILAHYFGAGTQLDIYYASFRVPDFIFAAAASIFSFSVLIPFLDEKLRQNKDAAKKFFNDAFTSFFVITVGLCIIAFFLMPIIEKWLYPSFTPYALGKTIMISRLLLLSPILLGYANLIASVTQLERRFVLYAVIPVIYNLAIVLGTIFLLPFFGVFGIALGVVIGALLQGLCQMPFVKRAGLLPKLSFPVSKEEIWKIMSHSLPRTFTLSAANLALVALVSLASQMTAGSISVLNFSMNLESVPLSIIGVSYSLAAFPVLSSLFVLGKKKEFEAMISAAGRHIIFYALPVTSLFVVLRAQIVRVILGSGAFTWDDTRLTAACLAIFCISVTFQCFSMLVYRAYYAAGQTKKPLLITLYTIPLVMAAPFILSFVFEAWPAALEMTAAVFRVNGIIGNEVIAVPLGYSIGMIVQGIVFFFVAAHDFKGIRSGIIKTTFQSLVASILASAVAYEALDVLGRIIDIRNFTGIFIQGFCAGILGIVVAVITFYFFKSEELIELWSDLRRRVSAWKTPLVAPEQTQI